VELEHGLALPLDQRSELKLHIEWIIANLVRVTKILNNLRIFGALPDIEYSVELEFAWKSPFNRPLMILNWSDDSFADSGVALATTPLKLPRLSFGPIDEIDEFLTQAHTDIFDACETNQHEPLPLKLVEK
jgi:hypothetical protein